MIDERRSQTNGTIRSAGPDVLYSTLGLMRVKMMLKDMVVLGIADAMLRQVKDLDQASSESKTEESERVRHTI